MARDELSKELTLREILETIITRARLFATVTVLVVVASILYAVFSTPVYKGDALIQIEEKKGASLGGVQELASALNVAQSPVLGEIDIIRSRQVLGKTITDLSLDISSKATWRVPYFADAFEEKQGGQGIALSEPYFGLSGLSWGGEKIDIATFDIPAEFYDRSFEVVLVDKSTYELTYRGDILLRGHLGQKEQFEVGGLQGQILISHAVGRSGCKFVVRKRTLLSTYEVLGKKLRVAETSRQSSVIRITYEANDPQTAARVVNSIASTYLSQNIARRSEDTERSIVFLDQQLPQLHKAVESAEEAFNHYRLQRQSINLDKESESLLTRSVDLEKERVEIEMKRKELAQRFTDSHPEVIALDQQLSGLGGEENHLSTEIKKLPETEQELLRLQRDVKVNTDLYIALLNDEQQLKIAKAGTIGNVYVIDFAIADVEPVNPKKYVVLLVGLLAGLFLGTISTFVARALNSTFRSSEEIESASGLPIYATIPESRTQLDLSNKQKKLGRSNLGGAFLFQKASDDPAIEALRTMTLGLQFATVDARNKNIVISGPLAGIGKTFVSTNLAAVLAEAGKKVLLIDADMRRGVVHKYIGQRLSPGLSDLLASKASVSETIIHDMVPGMDVICAGTAPPNPGELLGREVLMRILGSLESLYDYIIIDSPPLIPVGDTLALGKLAGAIFLVLRAELSTAVQLRDVTRKLENAGLAAKGLIFNGVRARPFSYRYNQYYSKYSPLPAE